jgi:hypothetical protein
LGACCWRLASGLLAGGWNFTLKPLQPKFETSSTRSPAWAGCSPSQQLGDTLKACGLAVLLTRIGRRCTCKPLAEFAELAGLPLPTALATAGALLRNGLLLLAAGWRSSRSSTCRCSAAAGPQPEDEPRRGQEGDSRSRGQRRGQGPRMRARMRELSSRRMLAAVPQADLVVMNPTHYAVALKYDEAKMSAPRVVAKGADLLALRIRDMARTPRCRCCRRRRWRVRCTRTPRSTRRSRPRCSVPWRRCWPGCTSCAPRWPGRRRCPPPPPCEVPPDSTRGARPRRWKGRGMNAALATLQRLLGPQRRP